MAHSSRRERAAGPTLITMQVGDQAPGSHQPLRQSEPDVRPLGFIAIGFAVVSLVLAPWFLLSPLLWLSAVLAEILGFVARGD